MGRFYAGLDLGQSADYTALSILEEVEDSSPRLFHLRHLERFALKTPYPSIVERVAGIMAAPPLAGASALVVDATGVGAPVVDLLERANLRPIPVIISGGDTVTQEGRRYKIPKRDLVSTLQVLLQSGRLKVAEGLPEAPSLVKELLNFQVKISLDTAHDSYGAWREGTHDDLVLSVALACWYALTVGGGWDLEKWARLVEDQAKSNIEQDIYS